MKPLVVGICGIKRSGSTVQFNLVRIALEQAGYKVNVCTETYKPREAPKGEVDLFKCHKFKKELAEAADHIFLTDRDDQGIIDSYTRFYGKKPPPGRIRDMRKHWEKWRRYSSIPFHYELWEESPEYYTLKVISYLHLDLNECEVLSEFNKIKLPTAGQDPKTLLFHNHRTST